MTRDQFKQAKHHFRVFDGGSLAQENAPVDDGKFRSRKGRPSKTKKARPNGFRAGNFIRQHAQSVNGPRLPEIDAHPIIRGCSSPSLKADAFGCRLRLQLVRQYVQVAPLPVVKKTPDGVEEVNRL